MPPKISQTEAQALIAKWMRTKDHGSAATYGYDLYLPNLINQHLGSPRNEELEMYLRGNLPMFLAAAWELARLGFLRPGTRGYHEQGNADGYGYSITPRGEAWLRETAERPFIPTEPVQIAQLLAKYRQRFGDGFHERAQDAIRAHDGLAFLACCVMCGAAAESILLSAADAKLGEVEARRLYRGGYGRKDIATVLLGPDKDGFRARIASGLELLNYWRDDAAHGVYSGIGENEAQTAIERLWALSAQFDDHWEALTAQDAPTA